MKILMGGPITTEELKPPQLPPTEQSVKPERKGVIGSIFTAVEQAAQSPEEKLLAKQSLQNFRAYRNKWVGVINLVRSDFRLSGISKQHPEDRDLLDFYLSNYPESGYNEGRFGVLTNFAYSPEKDKPIAFTQVPFMERVLRNLEVLGEGQTLINLAKSLPSKGQAKEDEPYSVDYSHRRYGTTERSILGLTIAGSKIRLDIFFDPINNFPSYILALPNGEILEEIVKLDDSFFETTQPTARKK